MKWIDANKPFGVLFDKERPAPSVQLELSNGDRHLVGDINANGGGCSCCPVLDEDTIIKRYRILLTEEQLNDKVF